MCELTSLFLAFVGQGELVIRRWVSRGSASSTPDNNDGGVVVGEIEALLAANHPIAEAGNVIPAGTDCRCTPLAPCGNCDK